MLKTNPTAVTLTLIGTGLFLFLSPRLIIIPNFIVYSIVIGCAVLLGVAIWSDRRVEPIFMSNPDRYPRTCLDCQKFGKVWGCVQCSYLRKQDDDEYTQRVEQAKLQRMKSIS